jgi:hypothetical protein
MSNKQLVTTLGIGAGAARMAVRYVLDKRKSK